MPAGASGGAAAAAGGGGGGGGEEGGGGGGGISSSTKAEKAKEKSMAKGMMQGLRESVSEEESEESVAGTSSTHPSHSYEPAACLNASLSISSLSPPMSDRIHPRVCMHIVPR